LRRIALLQPPRSGFSPAAPLALADKWLNISRYAVLLLTIVAIIYTMIVFNSKIAFMVFYHTAIPLGLIWFCENMGHYYPNSAAGRRPDFLLRPNNPSFYAIVGWILLVGIPLWKYFRG